MATDASAREAAVRAAEARFYAALREIHHGDAAALLATWSGREDVTTMNAAGGHERGRAAVAGRWTWWAGQGRPMPATAVEYLSFIVTAEMACTVALEHHEARVLRVTHVYVPEGETWLLVHRHADPLVERAP